MINFSFSQNTITVQKEQPKDSIQEKDDTIRIVEYKTLKNYSSANFTSEAEGIIKLKKKTSSVKKLKKEDINKLKKIAKEWDGNLIFFDSKKELEKRSKKEYYYYIVRHTK